MQADAISSPSTFGNCAELSSSPSKDRVAQAVVVGVFFVASVLISIVFWPGSLDADTLGELHEAATSHYDDWHTPLLSLLWRPFYLLGFHSPGWALFLGVFSLLLGFYLVLRVRFSRRTSTLVALLCCLYPPVLSWAVHVGVDAWFTAAIICAFGFAARSIRTSGNEQRASKAAAVWFAAVAMAARHNAFPAALMLFIVLAAESAPSRGRHRRTLSIALGILATFTVFIAESGVQWAIGTQSTNPVQATFIYDLAQLSKQEHRVLFPRSIDPGQNIQVLDSHTNVRVIDQLLFTPKPPLRFPVEGAAYEELKRAWESAILHNPGGYLHERLRLGVWMLSIGHPSDWLYNTPNSFPQYPPGFPSLNRIGYRYLGWLTIGPAHESGTVIYDGWIYALLLVAIAVLTMRRTPEERVLAALAVGILFYTVVLDFSGPGELYRYVYAMVAAGTVLTLTLLPVGRFKAYWTQALRAGRSGAQRAHARQVSSDLGR